MTESLFLGVDVGTGSVRAGLFTRAGRQVGRGEKAIRVWQEKTDHVEQSSDDIWQAACTSVKQALESAGVSGDAVAGIGFDATCSLVALDAEGKPVTVSASGEDERNVMVWMDHRALGDADEINAGGHAVLEYVGGKISPEMQTPKLRWLQRELPGTWQRTALWFDLPDYLTWRATGSTDRSLCSTVCKWTYLGHERRWDTGYLNAIGLEGLAADPAPIGDVVRVPGERIGELSASAGKELGLPAGIPVATSLIDAHAGALGVLGAAATEAPLTDRLAIIAGTSACHLALSKDKVVAPGVWGPYYEALIPEAWLLEGGISASGAFLDLVLASHPATRGSENAFDLAENAVRQQIEKGETEISLTSSVHLQPNVLGNRSPLAEPALKGGMAGWHLHADEADLARWYLAALQSLAYATRHIIEVLRESGSAVGLVVASGTSATNPRWCQVHADVLGIPVAVPEESDGVLLGSAMLGATAAGEYGSLEEAMTSMARPGHLYEPNPEMAAFHDRKYRVYRRMIDDQRDYDAMMRDA
ncbi:MAG: FGGY-family carbohydrate kinase [Pseudomonadales bacterium]|nr:FGGY-family carbohydrate kinase [Pseudomonadales bacterium]